MYSREDLSNMDYAGLWFTYKYHFGYPPLLKSQVNKREKLIECLLKDTDAYSLGYGDWPGITGAEPDEVGNDD